jgi:hypothetical protein
MPAVAGEEDPRVVAQERADICSHGRQPTHFDLVWQSKMLCLIAI